MLATHSILVSGFVFKIVSIHLKVTLFERDDMPVHHMWPHTSTRC